MKFSVYIATSFDGYIAKRDGGVDWLHTAGNLTADMGSEDMGFQAYIDSVDCMIMGRKCMEVIASMNLTPAQWPYGNTRIIVLSNTLTHAPENMQDKVEMYAGDLGKLVATLESEGYQHAYIDGGATIQAFLHLQLINEMTITQAPILLGEGIPLFAKTSQPIHLKKATSTTFKNDFVQVHYEVSYL